MKNINQLLKQQIELVKPDSSTLNNIKKTSDEFCKDLKRKLKSKNICADVFIGGSLAKKTIVKKKKYDVDIFVRFDKKYKDEEISKILGKALGKVKKIHGSRDYYQKKVNGIIMEVVPVLKIKNQKEAKNITDLSYFHVNYINKNVNKNKKLADEIILAKTFSHANNCYGAESYIHGFSGYSLELLICYYKSFLNFIKTIAENKEEKIVIDDARFYKNKEEALRQMNESKIQSPIILIDPTCKERNALAGLSKETFLKFKEACRKLLKSPSEDFFMVKDVRRELEKRYGNKLRTLTIKTKSQAGDIAGTKSKKFSEFFISQLKREFEVEKNEFDYDDEKNLAYCYFVVNKKKEETIRGPPVTNVHNLTRFKKAHLGAFIKNHIAYAKVKHEISLEKFIDVFKKKNKKILRDMKVKEIKLID